MEVVTASNMAARAMRCHAGAMGNHLGTRALAVVLVGLASQLAACSAVELFGSLEPTPSREPTRSATPTVAGGEPIPDPVDPPGHQPGETLMAGDATLTYLGVFEADGRFEARLRLEAGALRDDARLVAPDGSQLSLVRNGRAISSQPFGDVAAPPARDAVMTLVVSGLLIPLDVGKIR